MDWTTESFNDINKQGFMKLGRNTKKPKKAKKIIFCNRCSNWHVEGNHVKPDGTRG
jgi:hypothetical protein